jgi:putative transposase
MPDSLEQLNLLLIQVAKARQVRVDGIHFQSLRYISTTLAAYVGETVTCASTPETWPKSASSMRTSFMPGRVCGTGGATVPLREILRARNRQRRELRGVLRDRQTAVDTLLDLKRGEAAEKEDAPPAPDKPATKRSAPALKRYRNE